MPCAARPISSSSARTAASEVSPYITECPYCGHAAAQARAEDRARRPRRREPRPARAAAPRPSAPRLGRCAPTRSPGSRADGRPPVGDDRRSSCSSLFGYLLLAATVVHAIDLVAGRRASATSCGASPLVARFALRQRGCATQLAALLAIGIFGWLLERRHGAVGRRAVSCSAARAAWPSRAELDDPTPVACGGNGAALGAARRVGGPRPAGRARATRTTRATCSAPPSSRAVLLLMPLAVPRLQRRSRASTGLVASAWSSGCRSRALSRALIVPARPRRAGRSRSPRPSARRAPRRAGRPTSSRRRPASGAPRRRRRRTS